MLEGDLADIALLERIFGETPIAAVMHFAALSQNVANTQNLLETMLRYNVRRFIFSSTAALFGEPEYTPIDEQHPQRSINPYGRSKRMVEEMLADYDSTYGLHFASLRYFNVAGADPEGELGERHDPESHLIPLVLQAASGRRAQIAIYGDDYPTPDGTCVRDYIHVWDLCSAHLLALEHLLVDGESNTFNLGNGQDFSVQEVIDTARGISADVQPRRPGDPAVLVADSQKARDTLGWEPNFADLAAIIEHAWSWEQQKGTAW
ncbi:UDP-glucose 4-epimerase GalE [Acidithiobacillus ferrivorans]|uniref:UDP-glucose 4-epimerase GalE n=1 Tax=Acidithiobacillus ferrivorans TaxID=160808 RepID=UPI0022B7FBFE|nr:UDP-glucose 4-epimerase GalE [Acidithiobacillus ferrivorans]